MTPRKHVDKMILAVVYNKVTTGELYTAYIHAVYTMQ